MIKFATDRRAFEIICFASMPRECKELGLPHLFNIDIKYSFDAFDNGVVAALSRQIDLLCVIFFQRFHHSSLFSVSMTGGCPFLPLVFLKAIVSLRYFIAHSLEQAKLRHRNTPVFSWQYEHGGKSFPQTRHGIFLFLAIYSSQRNEWHSATHPNIITNTALRSMAAFVTISCLAKHSSVCYNKLSLAFVTNQRLQNPITSCSCRYRD